MNEQKFKFFYKRAMMLSLCICTTVGVGGTGAQSDMVSYPELRGGLKDPYPSAGETEIVLCRRIWPPPLSCREIRAHGRGDAGDPCGDGCQDPASRALPHLPQVSTAQGWRRRVVRTTCPPLNPRFPVLGDVKSSRGPGSRPGQR